MSHFKFAHLLGLKKKRLRKRTITKKKAKSEIPSR